MSDLVGNPEDRFSRVAALILHDSHLVSDVMDVACLLLSPRSEW